MPYTSLFNLLGELEMALKKAGLWQVMAPPPAALKSSAPFCCDTLSFNAWLQFIFLPRFTALLKSGEPLPAMALAPMAEHVWGQQPEFAELVSVITQLDDAVNAA
ncbi:YqcC family protein [Shewanella sp.]|uniref:YqcC family protein n=1 Tax=Shewanella sp. TaxID=50422 RepID=UPI00356A661C